MPQDISRLLNSPRERVFDAWTQREHLARWFGPKGVTIRTARLDLRPGGMHHFCVEYRGGLMWGRWVFREVTPPERIVYINSFSDEKGRLVRHPANPSLPAELLATIRFDEEGDRTRVTLRYVPLHASEVEKRAFREGFDVVARTNELLDKLQAYLEG